MNGLTTIASLPSGSGSLAQQDPEVGEEAPLWEHSINADAWVNKKTGKILSGFQFAGMSKSEQSAFLRQVAKPKVIDMTGHPIWGPLVQMRAPYFAWLNEPETEMPGVLTQEEMLALITWGYP